MRLYVTATRKGVPGGYPTAFKAGVETELQPKPHLLHAIHESFCGVKIL